MHGGPSSPLVTGAGSIGKSTKKMAGAGSAQLLGSTPRGQGRKWRAHGALNRSRQEGLGMEAELGVVRAWVVSHRELGSAGRAIEGASEAIGCGRLF